MILAYLEHQSPVDRVLRFRASHWSRVLTGGLPFAQPRQHTPNSNERRQMHVVSLTTRFSNNPPSHWCPLLISARTWYLPLGMLLHTFPYTDIAGLEKSRVRV